VRPADLARHRMIAAPLDTSPQSWVFSKDNGNSDGGGESVALDASFTVNSMIMQKQAALGAMGIALLPLEMVADELHAGTLVRILDDYAVLNGDVAVSLVYPSREFVPRKVREFTYPKGLLLRRVNNSGDISWHKDRVFISEVFRFEDLGFELVAEDFYKVFFRDTGMSVPEHGLHSGPGTWFTTPLR